MPEGLFTGLAKCGTEPSASSHCGSGCGNELRSALRKPGSMDPAHSSGSGSSTVCRRMCGRADKGVKASAGPDMASSGATDAAISQSGPTPSNCVGVDQRWGPPQESDLPGEEFVDRGAFADKTQTYKGHGSRVRCSRSSACLVGQINQEGNDG